MSTNPPDEGSSGKGGKGALPIVIGVVIGLLVGVFGHSIGGSPWLWYLAPVLGLAIGLVARR